jgi:hypothetical protein
VTELPLAFVASQTHFITIALQQGHFVGPVHSVACITFLNRISVNEFAVFMSPESILMTVTANDNLASFQQQFRIPGMGTVTIHATVAFTLEQMIMKGIQLLVDLFMAF